MMHPSLATTLIAATLVVAGCAASHVDRGGLGPHAQVSDSRQAVEFPAPLKEHTLANMRDHLATLQRIQDELGRAEYDAAAHLAESRLGLTSLTLHGAHDVSKYMPEGMQRAGLAMHQAASRFAIEATNAGATGDARKAVGALGAVTAQCVACHAGYRFK